MKTVNIQFQTAFFQGYQYEVWLKIIMNSDATGGRAKGLQPFLPALAKALTKLN